MVLNLEQKHSCPSRYTYNHFHNANDSVKKTGFSFYPLYWCKNAIEDILYVWILGRATSLISSNNRYVVD